MADPRIDRLMQDAIEALPPVSDERSALLALLNCVDDDTTDCVDNYGAPYQSHALCEAIRAARRIVSLGDPQP